MRRFGIMLLGFVVLVNGIRAEKKKDDAPSPRYGIAVDLRTYPQNSAKEAFASVLKAIENKRIDYLLAQLTDPVFIDDRVQRLFGGKFDEQVAETKAKLDPAAVKQLQRFQEKGEWSGDKEKAVLRLKDLPDRIVLLKKTGTRWYLKNQNRQPEPTGTK